MSTLKLIKNKGHIERYTPPTHPETVYVIKYNNGEECMYFALTEVFNYIPKDDSMQKKIDKLFIEWERNKLPLLDKRVMKWVRFLFNEKNKNTFFNDDGHSVMMSGMEIDIVKFQDRNVAVRHVRKFYPKFKLKFGSCDVEIKYEGK